MDVTSVRGVVVVRVAKAVLVAIVALLMTLIALDNIVNYDANWQFVHHVLAMDTIFPGSLLLWRAITAPGLQTAAYASIIGWESLCALVNIAAVIALIASARSAGGYARAVPIAAVGLTMVMLLFGAGFLAIGGEWFLMWQSKIWNGTEAATRYFGIAAFTLVALLAGERGDDTA